VIRGDLLTQKYKLRERQKIASGYALEHGGLTIQDYMRLFPDVSRRTLQRELKEMVDKGLLLSEGATNRLYYRLARVKL
jgi:predicted HTH transcriptional regulator